MGDVRALLALARADRLARSAWFAATVWPVPGPRRRGRVSRRVRAAVGSSPHRGSPDYRGNCPPRPGPVAAAAGRSRASLNPRLASNLQQGIVHTRSSAQRAEPGRAGAHPAPRGGPLPASRPGRLEPLCAAACAGFRRRPSAAVRRRRSGSIRAVSVVPRRRTAAHRCARIARLATAARCRCCCRRPAACRRG
jgi:hypothetical protein